MPARSAIMPRPLADLGAGLTTKPPSVEPHPGGPVQHGAPGQIERAFTAASTFFSGMLAISASQFLGAPLKAIDPKFYEAYMAFTKQSFGVLITTMTQWWSPTVVRVSGDKSLPKQLFKKPDGNLECRFPKRLILMANHQLYTDWLYLWWVAYTNNMHGYIYIILKESLKNVPIIGWGAQFYNFIFLSRRWETDKSQFQQHLDKMNDAKDPMWLLIFPEGTNLAEGTREKSREWAAKNGLQDMKHQLLPRSRGLQFSLQRLKDTTEWLYDCTIGYEGIPPGEFGQDIFTLRSSMFEGQPPKSVNLHFRRFKIADIPIHSDKAFDVWLRNRWREKDYLLEHFVRFDRFPDDDMWMAKQQKASQSPLIRQSAKCIETQIKSNSLEEFLSIFAPITSVLMVLFLVSGEANPQEMLKSLSSTGNEGMEKIAKALENAPKGSLDLKKMLQGAMPPGLGATGHASDAQRQMAQKYINSVRPAAAKQIQLPNRALRRVPLKKAAYVPGASTKATALDSNGAPSVASASVNPRSSKLSRASSGNSVVPIPVAVSAQSLVTRSSKAKSAQGGARGAVIPAAKNSSTAMNSYAMPTAATSKPIKVEPLVLSRMRTADKAKQPRELTKTKSSKPLKATPKPTRPEPREIKIDPGIVGRLKRGG